MKHLKYFEEVSAYEAFKNSADYVLPNISYIVETDSITYDPEASSGYIMVDLGLPSGLKWADRNIGATSPEDAGLYFQWGDTVGYTVEQITEDNGISYDYDYVGYFDTNDQGATFNKYELNKLTILESEDDAATVNMGSKYRMPTKADFEELIDNTTVTYIDIEDNELTEEEFKDVWIEAGRFKGIKLTGINGNSIYIPAAGVISASDIRENSYFLTMWSSELSGHRQNSAYAYYLFSCSEGESPSIYVEGNKFEGKPVRGVCN